MHNTILYMYILFEAPKTDDMKLYSLHQSTFKCHKNDVFIYFMGNIQSIIYILFFILMKNECMDVSVFTTPTHSSSDHTTNTRSLAFIIIKCK